MAIALHRQGPRARAALTETSAEAGKLIAIGNLKGGTGKSTLAVNLAGALSAQGKRVCLADCDPQGTSSSWLAKGYIKVVTETLPVNQVGEVVGWLGRITDLSRRFDIVIIDLPSVVTPAMASAFLLAHLILIPVSPSTIDLHGTRRVMRHVRTVREERRDAKPKVMLVPTRVPEDQLAQSTLEGLFAEFSERIGPPLRERRAFYEAFAQRRWVGQIASEEAAHADIAVLHAAVTELLDVAPTPPLLTGQNRLLTEPQLAQSNHIPANDRGMTAEPVRYPQKSWFRRLLSLLT